MTNHGKTFVYQRGLGFQCFPGQVQMIVYEFYILLASFSRVSQPTKGQGEIK